jgi:pyridoxine 5'-phosphate synthase PdxJ
MTVLMTKLSVNVNKIALLRNARALDLPDLGRLAGLGA